MYPSTNNSQNIGWNVDQPRESNPIEPTSITPISGQFNPHGPPSAAAFNSPCSLGFGWVNQDPADNTNQYRTTTNPVNDNRSYYHHPVNRSDNQPNAPTYSSITPSVPSAPPLCPTSSAKNEGRAAAAASKRGGSEYQAALATLADFMTDDVELKGDQVEKVKSRFNLGPN